MFKFGQEVGMAKTTRDVGVSEILLPVGVA